MATTAKQNGTPKKRTTPVKQNGKVTTPDPQKTTEAPVVKKLAEQAIGQHPEKSLDEKIQGFEKLKGLANQRERLVSTLHKLNKFKYNNGDTCVFLLRDEDHQEFQTGNTTLIKLVTDVLQEQLEHRKTEIEIEILNFEL